MPEHDDLDTRLDPRLDRAFAALTDDLSRSSGPGAAAAISTARRHRRTRVGAVALAAVVALAGGLALPDLRSSDDGIAAGGGSTRLDASAVERVTDGWIEGWTGVQPGASTISFGAESCFTDDVPADSPAGAETTTGTSLFAAGDTGLVSVLFTGYASSGDASTAQDQAYPPPDTCSETSWVEVDGVRVRHDAMPPGTERDGSWQTDVWSVQIGEQRGEVSLVTDLGVADEAVAGRMAQALVAGLRDGWTDSGTVAVTPTTGLRPALPEVDDRDLRSALRGWAAAEPSDSTTVGSFPDLPCVTREVRDGSVAALGSADQRQVSWSIGGFSDAARAAANVDRMLDQARTCTEPEMTPTTVARGVTLVTYDTARPNGHGALWLLARGDRAMAVGVSGAAGPMPDGVADDVAAVMVQWLQLPWPPASGQQ